jgi:hypothetical protein
VAVPAEAGVPASWSPGAACGIGLDVGAVREQKAQNAPTPEFDVVQPTAAGEDSLEVRTAKAHAQFVEVQEEHATGGVDGSVLDQFGADLPELPVHLREHHHDAELEELPRAGELSCPSR